MLSLPDDWVWDFWFASHEGRHHVFFLKAPKSLGDPDLRHWNARIGHAVSDDLRTWELLPDALGPGPAGSWDDRATWTGSVLAHEGIWHLFYTGVSHAEDGLVQRIGLARSEDLLTFEKVGGNPLVTTDPRWYEELDTDVWVDETCRDPWVMPDPAGDGFHMLFTARVRSGPPDGRGALGHARSADLLTWEVQPPLAAPGDFGHLEVPQVVRIGAWHYVIFCVYEWAHAASRLERAHAVCGTHYLMGGSPLGPFELPGDDFLSATPHGAFYAGKVVETPQGWVFLSWAQFDEDGTFVGVLADPVPVVQEPDGRLRLAQQPRLDRAALPRPLAVHLPEAP